MRAMTRGGFVDASQRRFSNKKTAREIKRRAFSIDEVSASYGVSSGLIRLEIQREKLRAIHVGRRVLIPQESLDAYFGGTSEA